MRTIDELWAWIVEGSADDNGEGIPAVRMRDGKIMPLVGADRARIESFRRHAEQCAEINGATVKLVRFTTRTEMDVILPKATTIQS